MQKNISNLSEELMRVVIHGVFHLCGYGDKTAEQKKKMRAKEQKALDLFYSR